MAAEGKRKVLAVMVDRANYGRLRPVLGALKEHPGAELSIVCGGSMVLRRFDRTVDQVRRDGFEVAGEIYIELEGSTPMTMAKSVGLSVMEFSNELRRLSPDVVLIIGDRYEALGAAIAAAYMNIPICHVQGGEVSGSIDESARHAITKFAQYHVPATERAAEFIRRMGEPASSILAVGCPSSDIAFAMGSPALPPALNERGAGREIGEDDTFLMCVFHPTTTAFGSEHEQVEEVLGALDELAMPTLLLWPNIDAGSDALAKQIRVFRDRAHVDWLRTITNLSPDDYLAILARAAVLVGNSSSFVRDAGYFGTPVVLVGGRQQGREHDAHARKVGCKRAEIVDAVKAQLGHESYAPSTLYGDGKVAVRVADALVDAPLFVQKRLAYQEVEGR